MALTTKSPLIFTNTDEGATNFATSVISHGRLRISGFRWVGVTFASGGHQCIVHDVNGREIWKSEWDYAAFIANFRVDEMAMDMWIDGLVINTLDSGTLYVYLYNG